MENEQRKNYWLPILLILLIIILLLISPKDSKAQRIEAVPYAGIANTINPNFRELDFQKSSNLLFGVSTKTYFGSHFILNVNAANKFMTDKSSSPFFKHI